MVAEMVVPLSRARAVAERGNDRCDATLWR
jgi:hypothetical protein